MSTFSYCNHELKLTFGPVSDPDTSVGVKLTSLWPNLADPFVHWVVTLHWTGH